MSYGDGYGGGYGGSTRPDGVYVEIDWSRNGDYAGIGENVTTRVRGGLSVAYGRDQSTALAPTVSGTGSFTLDNESRDYCLEPAAEALAYGRGWVTHDQLQTGDQILAYDPVGDSIRWEPIEAVVRLEYSGNLIRWRSSGIDVASTPEHRWWTVGTSGRVRYEPRFRTTSEISGHQLKVKIGGGQAHCFATEPTYTDDFVELLGWVFTEGWFEAKRYAERLCRHCQAAPARGWNGPAVCDGCAYGPMVRGARQRPRTAARTRTGFAQSQTANPKKVAQIRELVDRLVAAGHPISEYQHRAVRNGSIMSAWRFSGQLDRMVRDALPDKGLTAALLCSLTREQGELLLDTVIRGDGTVGPSGRYFFQKNKTQLGLVAMLCAMLGIRTTTKTRPGESGVWALRLCSVNRATGNSLNHELLPYEGVVWCPRIRTGIFLARCRGRTFWTGNSPRNTASPLAGNLKPARPVRITRTVSATDYTLFYGHTDDQPINPQNENGAKWVSLSLVDTLADFGGQTISTPLYSGIRTGQAISYILDACGWSASLRDLDPGATIIPWFWCDQKDARTALEEIIRSEGPPALLTIGAGGSIVFRDRHHRLLRTTSITSQATWRDSGTVEPVMQRSPGFYNEAWSNIINTGSASVDVRTPQELQQVWTADTTISLSNGESRLITASPTDPFYGAVPPVAGVDFVLTSGTVTTALTKTSGGSTTIIITAVGGDAVITGLQLRAQPVTVAYTVQVSASDADSIDEYGPRSFPGDLPWCGVDDAKSVLSSAVAQRARPLPILSARFMLGANTAKAAAILARDMSDRVTVIEQETATNGDFYIESFAHQMGNIVDHEVTVGTEAVPTEAANVARADIAGVGADIGVAGAGLDDPAFIAITDSTVAGHRVDEGLVAA